MCEGMIQKNPEKLRLAMSHDAHLVHMTGKVETREEYIEDILDGTLNYYDYKIMRFSEDEALVQLLAKVYGGAKSWWTLRMDTVYAMENGLTKIKQSKVRLG